MLRSLTGNQIKGYGIHGVISSGLYSRRLITTFGVMCGWAFSISWLVMPTLSESEGCIFPFANRCL